MPAMAVESGPAAGVVAAALVARQTGKPDLLSFDMGGTTAKASLIRDGKYETTPEYEVGGGSSMTRFDERRRPSDPRAGDRSCRGLRRRRIDRLGRPGRRAARRTEERGRRARPGLLWPRRHRADRHRLQPPARLSRQAIAARRRAADRSCSRRGRRATSGSPSRSASMCATAAAAVIDIVNHAMAEALKIVSVQRGHDPRDFALAAFGGAGPLHAAALAEELGIATVICPPIPGAFSALGLVGTRSAARLRAHRYTTRRRARRSVASARSGFRALEARRRRHARSRRRRRRAPPLRSLRRCALRRPILRASIPCRVAGGAIDAAASAGSPKPSTHRHAQTYGHDNRARAGADRQRAPRRDRRDRTADRSASSRPPAGTPMRSRPIATLWFRGNRRRRGRRV